MLKEYHFTIFVFANLFNALLERRHIDVHICFSIKPDVMILVKIFKENPGLPRYVIRKKKSIFVVFSNNCGYSLILCQNLTVSGFLTVSCHIVSEIM